MLRWKNSTSQAHALACTQADSSECSIVHGVDHSQRLQQEADTWQRLLQLDARRQGFYRDQISALKS